MNNIYDCEMTLVKCLLLHPTCERQVTQMTTKMNVERPQTSTTDFRKL